MGGRHLTPEWRRGELCQPSMMAKTSIWALDVERKRRLMDDLAVCLGNPVWGM
jgi:hypothetical protein